MRRKSVVLDLAPGRIIASAKSGARRARTHRVALDTAHWDETWQEGLRPIAGDIRTAIESVGGKRADVTVVCQSPGSATDVISVPIKGAAAEEAARLSLIDSASLNPMTDPIDVCVIGQDAAGETIMTHVLACALRGSEAESICRVIEESGANPVRLVPASAIAMTAAVRAALAKVEDPTAHLFMGEYASALAASNKGSLSFVRTIDVGVDVLVESIARAFPDVTQIESRERARRVLKEYGIPSADQVIDEERRLRGSHLLPLIQPVLQRLIVETKQTFRFALDDAHRDNLSVLIEGEGADIAGLNNVLADQLERPVDYDELTTKQARAQMLRLLRPIALMPYDRAMSRLSHRINTSLAMAAMIACALLVGEAALTHAHAASVEAEFKSLKPSLRMAEQGDMERQRFNELIASLQEVESLVAKYAGASAHWRAVMLEFFTLAPPAIEFAAFDASTHNSVTTVSFRGQAVAPDYQAARHVRDFANALQASPLTKRVTLGQTERTSTERGNARRFMIEVELRPIPATAIGAAIDEPIVAPGDSEAAQ